MNFDECLSAIGGFGTYQKVIIYLVLLPAVLPCAFHAYNQVFMSTMPEHRRCIKEPENQNYTNAFIKNISVPSNGNGENNSCEVNNVNLSNASQIKDIYCKRGWMYGTSKYSATVVTEWDLVCEKEHYTTTAMVLFGVGGLLGNLAFGYIQDSLGRRPAFFTYMLAQTVFSIGSAFANSFPLWTALRFGVGLTVPSILGTPYVLSVELVNPEKRAFCMILINIIYSLGLIALSAVAYLIREWRQLTLTTTVPFIVFFLYWWVLPESPRWLAANGKFDNSEKILRNIARINGKTWSSEYINAIKSIYNEEFKSRQRNRYGITDLFRYPELRMNTLIITFLWFANTSVYVGLSYYTPQLGGNEFFNFFLSAAVELPTYLFLLQAMEKGRRQTLCLSMTVGGLACLGTIALNKAEKLLLTLYCIAKMGISSSFVVLPLLASELYPTVVRGIGISFGSVIGQVGPVIIPIINYLGKDWLTLPLFIMGIISVAGGALGLLLPETVNLHLPQNIENDKRTKQMML